MSISVKISIFLPSTEVVYPLNHLNTQTSHCCRRYMKLSNGLLASAFQRMGKELLTYVNDRFHVPIFPVFILPLAQASEVIALYDPSLGIGRGLPRIALFTAFFEITTVYIRQRSALTQRKRVTELGCRDLSGQNRNRLPRKERRDAVP